MHSLETSPKSTQPPPNKTKVTFLEIYSLTSVQIRYLKMSFVNDQYNYLRKIIIVHAKLLFLETIFPVTAFKEICLTTTAQIA